MTTIPSNSQKNQLGVFLIVVTASSLFLVTSLINPISQISQQQYVFAQKNTGVLAYNKISTTTLPQIHNYTSSPPAPVNSWIIESKNGVVVVDTQRQFSEAKKLLKVIEDINKPILGVIFTHPHPDHINGAAALLNGTANVPVYATQSTFNVLKNDTGGYIELSKQLLPTNEYSDQIVLPNRIVKSGDNM
jgi:glyoxylase-like metal-dependent hydrolase (beta-lactamase superfamily II)